MKTNKTNGTNEIIYCLFNSQNYKKDLDCELSDVAEKISQLFLDYFKLIKENIKIKKAIYNKFIIIRGLDTIISVFNYILFYTKNLDLTYFHCQKAFYLYVEFVSQITNDDKTFLQLSSKDATTYVYKKTIYEINNELKKINSENPDYTKLKLINNYIDLYRTLLLYLINNELDNNEYINYVENLYKTLNKLKNATLIEKLNTITDKFYYCVKDIDKFYSIINLIVKKMVKTPGILENRINKFLSEDFLGKLNEPTDKFILWFAN